MLSQVKITSAIHTSPKPANRIDYIASWNTSTPTVNCMIGAM